jgi:hypothetical protein
MVLQSCKSPNFGNFETLIWESQEKCNLDDNPMASHRVYYKGEGGGFPQVWAMVSLVNLSLPVIRPSTKNVQIMR